MGRLYRPLVTWTSLHVQKGTVCGALYDQMCLARRRKGWDEVQKPVILA
jgi:hypothetical protein